VHTKLTFWIYQVNIQVNFNLCLKKTALTELSKVTWLVDWQAAVDLWLGVLSGPLQTALNSNNAQTIRSTICDCLSNVGQNVFVILPVCLFIYAAYYYYYSTTTTTMTTTTTWLLHTVKICQNIGWNLICMFFVINGGFLRSSKTHCLVTVTCCSLLICQVLHLNQHYFTNRLINQSRI